MSNGTVESVGPTPPTDSPVDVYEAQVQQAVQEAKEKGEELVKAEVIPPAAPEAVLSW